MTVFASSQHFAGLVLTEINPDHAPDAEVLPHFIGRLGSALSSVAPIARSNVDTRGVAS
jgi:arginase